MMSPAHPSPLILHVVYRFDFGGLENGLVNLINRMPRERFRHAIACLTSYSDFAKRIERDDVEVIALNKRAGKDFGCYLRFAGLIRRLRPRIVHTRNLGTLDMQFVAAACGVAGRVHGEHGWDVYDLNGQNPKYLRLRRLARRVVKRYVAMSKDLRDYLERDVHVSPSRVSQIYSGVNGVRFRPRTASEPKPWPAGFVRNDTVVFGTVGRLEPVKNPLGLLQSFGRLVETVPGGRERMRLVFVGAGPLREELERAVSDRKLSELVWLAGGRNDVPDLIRHFDVFVLPSLNEGISNTILEAMASGVPVVAGRVGGNPEIVRDGVTGSLYAPNDPDSLTSAMRAYAFDAGLRERHGVAARGIVEERHTLEAMVRQYLEVYDSVH